MPYLSRFANMLLSSPFDSMAEIDPQIRRLLTKDEFIEHCFSEPQFEHKNLDDESDELISADNYFYNKNELLDQWYSLKKYKENFFNWLHNGRTDGVYTISGNAGTGKTTYVNYLCETVADHRWIVLNMTKASNTVVWLNDHMTNFSAFELAYKKIYSSILEYIKSAIFDVPAQTDKEYCEKVKATLDRICRNYKNKFGKSIRSKNKFFETLCPLATGGGSGEILIEKIVRHFADSFDKLLSDNDFSHGLPRLMEIFLIFIRCLNDEDKMTVIVFDNLERFVCDDELFNDEIDEIRKKISNYAKNLESDTNRNSNLFKFIMVVRNKTARMLGVRLQSADNLPKNLDISEWFDIYDIIDKKAQWLQNKSVNIKKINFLRSIASDCKVCSTGEVTGLQRFIEPLFNNNKRLIVDFLGMLIERPNYEKNIELYYNLMKEDNKICRFAARSIVRGLILQRLETEDSLFKNLMTYRDNRTQGIGVTRKILTVLHNSALDAVADISIMDVISRIFNLNEADEYLQANDRRLDSFFQALFYMNSYNRRTNDWIQLVDLQIKNENKKTVIERWEDLKDLISKKRSDIYLNIMPAGEAYLRYIVTSFEFFSLRYINPYEPLFTLIPDENEMNSVKTTDIRCFKKICEVSRRASDCISRINDNLRLKWERGAHGVLHKDRIKQAFYDYIDKFLYMLRYRRDSENNWDDDKYRDLVDNITYVRDSFRE